MTDTETPPAPAVLQIDLQKLTNYLDAATSTWQAVVTAETPTDRLELLRIHTKHLRQYFESLDAFLDAAPGAE